MTYTIRVAFPPPPIPAGVTVQRADIVQVHPHDRGAFTQGLLWCDGRLYESTGEVGKSEIRELRLEDGAVLRRAPFPADAWGEGIADWGDEIIGLTLSSGTALRWDRESFAPRGALPCAGQGWGLARSGDELAMSDGSDLLRFVDPASFAVRRTLAVTEAGRPLRLLNDLAFVRGELFANVFMTDTIARIDPATGEVRARIDLSAIVARSGRRDIRDVLNGIAWDADEDRLFVTGKNWPNLFEISLPPVP
ncbi:MAG TPA: glutaminyl-peptide cyclotransferase [Allosphingosinicella sp.]|nr:glutaminyl-peptide cyclotransferase [Allosphingosinicella sp.]